ncbi:MAG: DUF3352 domain-containing protein [Flavobacteriales bacterium]|nr:DUF3352 domain-containing protein [Flavobacteriales bacterium]
MNRLIWIFLAIVVAGAALGGYLWSQHEVEAPAHPLQAIAADAPLILEFNNLNAAIAPLAATDYAQKMLLSEMFGGVWSRTAVLDSLFARDAMLSSSSGFHALSMDAAKGLLTVLKPVGEIPSAELREHLLALAGMAAINESAPDVMHHPGLALRFAVSNGLILVAADSARLREAMEMLRSGRSAFNDEVLTAARASAGKNVQMNIYARMPSPMFGQGSLWHEVGDLLALDLTTKAEGLVMNGFAHLPDSSAQMLTHFRDQQPQPMAFQGGIPADVSSFLMLAVSDLTAWRASVATEARGQSRLDSLSLAIGSDVAAHFLPWMTGQFGVCRLPIRSGRSEDFVLMQANSPELADQLLHSLAKAVGADSSALRPLPINGLIRMLFGPMFPSAQQLYFARHNEFVVFGPDAESLGIYLHQLRADHTLASDLGYSTFSEQFSSSFNVFSYQRLPLEMERIADQITGHGRAMLGDLKEMSADFPAFGVQFSNAGGAFYTNIHWKYDPDWTSRPLDEAVATMDAPMHGRPAWMVNHLSGEPEIIVQDMNNMLYLFNRNGQELFRRQLSEAIHGDVVQVDRYRNNSLQYVFATNNYIYQMDRNGKDVDGFPLELESPLSVPLTVVDYEGKRDYRFLAVCKNNRVYNYGVDGKAVKGWKFDRLNTAAATPFAYLSHDRKDYLVIGETSGKLHLLDRTGSRRSAIRESVSPGQTMHFQPFTAKKKDHVGFYTSDSEGTVMHLLPNGKVKLLSFGKFTVNHRFLVTDLNGDGEPEFIISDLNMMKAFSWDKKLLFEQRLVPGAIGPFAVRTGDRQWSIGISLPDDGQILLVGPGGAVANGFPLGGQTEFGLVALPSGERLVAVGTAQGLIVHTLK